MKKFLWRKLLALLLLLSLTLQGPLPVFQPELSAAMAEENVDEHTKLVEDFRRELAENDKKHWDNNLDDPVKHQEYAQDRQKIFDKYKYNKDNKDNKDKRPADFDEHVAKKDAKGNYDPTKDYISSGGDPKSPESDMDITAIKDGGGKKLADKMNDSGKGYQFKKDPHNSHRYIDETRNIVIWEKPPQLKEGSRQWKDWVRSSGMAKDTFSSAGGLYETSDGKMGVKDPQGAVLDNVKKASEAGLTGKGTDLSDGKTIGKSVVKAAEWSNTDIDPGFKKQCETLQQGGSWEQARVTDFKDPPEVREQKISEFKKKANAALQDSAKNAKSQSDTLMKQRRQTLTDLDAKPRSAWTKQDLDAWNKTKAEITTINETNKATLKGITKNSPQTGAELAGRKIKVEADGKITDLYTKKTMSPEHFAKDNARRASGGKAKPLPADPKPSELTGIKKAAAGADVPSKRLGTASDAPSAKPLKGTKPADVDSPHVKTRAGTSKLEKAGAVAGILGRIYGVYMGLKACSDHLEQEAKRDPENFGMLTLGEALALGAGTFLGIQGAIDTTHEYYAQDLEQYYRDQAKGKKWNLTPEQWTAIYLGWEGAKMIPAAGDILTISELGYVTAGTLDAYYEAYKKALEAMKNEEAMKERYKPLSDLISKAIGGGPLPPVWEKNRFKYWRIFEPILKDPQKMAELMNSTTPEDLKKWVKKFKDQRAQELGITFGTPGADNPDDNENIGAALLALPVQERALWLRALSQGDFFVTGWLQNRDPEISGHDLNPETLGAFLDAALDPASLDMAPQLSPEQKSVIEEVRRDVIWNVALTPDVAILSSGYARGAASLMGASEAAVIIRPDANPNLLANYRLLIIPSGALSDYAGSARFKALIEHYLESGGTVLAFAQQLGREYGAIPGDVKAYGFAEDQSCQYASARVMKNIGAFASMTKAEPDFNVDGYFLDYPEKSEIWLSRTKNGQPCMIAYPWKKGRVVLSTLYLDWAAGNHQSTSDEKLFFRDLLAYLLDNGEVPFIERGASVKIQARSSGSSSEGVTVQVPEGVHWKSFKPLVLAPDGSQIETQSGPEGILIPSASQSGFYSVGADFFDESGKKAGFAAPQKAFVVSVLPRNAAAPSENKAPLNLSLASDLENYVRGAQARFTALFWERTGQDQDLKVQWRFIHNSWASSPENKKLYEGTDQVRLPAEGTFTLEKVITVINDDGNDRFYVDVFDAKSGARLASMSKGFYTHAPRTEISLKLDKEACEVGGSIKAELSFENPFKAASAGSVRFVILDGAGRSRVSEEKSFTAEAEKAEASQSLKLPSDMTSGPCSVQAYVILKGSMIGAGSAVFNYLGAPETFKGILTDRITKKPVPKGTLSFHLGKTLFETASDEKGAFELQIPAGKFALQAQADEYNPFTGDMILSRENQPLKVELLPSGSGLGTGKLKGRVIDRVTGEALPHMELSLHGRDESHSLRSDAAGNWSAALLPGNYEVRCLIDGSSESSSRFDVKVEEGLELEQNLYPAVGKLRFKVFDGATGQEAQKVQALIRTNNGWTRDVSSSLNRERIERLRPGCGQIRLTAAGYETLETAFYAGERPADFTAYLRPLKCAESFEVLDWVTEKPLAQARVTIDSEGAPAETTDAKGIARFHNVDAGRRRITLEATGYQKLKTEAFFTISETVPRRLYLKPDRAANPGSARFVVKNLISGEPLDSVKIVWNDRTILTKTDGTAELPLPDGRQRLTFSREGFKALETECLMNAVNAEAETYWLAPLNTVRSLVLRDLVTNKPLKDVKISLSGKPLGNTGKDGVLAVTVPTGRLKFRFEHKDFEPLETELFLNACVQEKSLSEEIYLQPRLGSFAYRALARDPDGRPLKGVEVTLKAGDREYKTQTDAKGSFAFKLPPGSFSLKLSLTNFHNLETTGYSGGGNRKGIVEDYVLYPSDAPLPSEKGGILFEIRDLITSEPVTLLRGKLSGKPFIYEEGLFECENAPGRSDLTFAAEGYESLDLRGMAFFPGQKVKRLVHMRPLRAEVEFRVLDAISGKPLPKFAGSILDRGQSAFAEGLASGTTSEKYARTNFWAEGYSETGDFYPINFAGRKITRTIALWPSEGAVEFRVRDALNGAPLEKFVGRVLDSDSMAYADGLALGQSKAGNRRSAFWSEGYAETGDFYPTVFAGRKAERNVSLWPTRGTVEFRLSDAVTGANLERFTGIALDSGSLSFCKEIAVRQAQEGNRRSAFQSEGYVETGDFYPPVFAGRKVLCPVSLWPSKGVVDFQPMDALTSQPLERFVSLPLDQGARAFAAGASASVKAPAWRNKRTWFEVPGYRGISDYYPAAYPGRTVQSKLFMTPQAPEGQATLRAFDVATGRTVRGATFRLDGRDFTAPSGEIRCRKSTDFARLSLGVRAPGYRDSSASVFFTAGRRDLTVSVPMTPIMPRGLGRLLLTVADSAKKPLAGAVVTLPLEKGSVKAVTNASGQVLFDRVPSGVPSLSIRKEGFAGTSLRAAVAGGRTSRASALLRPLSETKAPVKFTPVITAVPEGEILRPGSQTTLKFTVENRGGVGGSALCSVMIPDVRSHSAEVTLGPGESREIALPVTVPDDAATSRILVKAKAEEAERDFMLEIRAPSFELTAQSDKEAYTEGGSMSVTLTAEAEKGTPDGDYQFRVTWNDQSWTQDVRLKDGKAEAAFSDIPVSFSGNKLLFALYHASGRSVVINALPVLNSADEILMIPHKPQYQAGETARIKVRSASESELTLRSPLFGDRSLKPEEKLLILSEESEETEFEFTIPSPIPTGVYEIRCGDFAAPLSVRGFETKILDRNLDESGDGEKASLTLSWRAATRGEIPCDWTLTARNPLDNSQEAQEIAKGSLTLAGAWAEYAVSVEIPAEEPRDLELKLVPRGLETPLAKIYYSWDGRK